GTIGSAFVQHLWQMYLTVGLLTAVGSGATQPTGAAVIARWFEARRGLALGIAGAAMSGSQLIVIPLATALMLSLGWRASFLALGIALLVLVLPVGATLIRNDPEERGLRPYGATGPVRLAAEVAALQRSGRVSVTDAARVPQFWLLMATYFVCGYTSMGMILTHFIPHALEHGFTAIQDSTALGGIGAMDMVGTVGTWWNFYWIWHRRLLRGVRLGGGIGLRCLGSRVRDPRGADCLATDAGSRARLIRSQTTERPTPRLGTSCTSGL